MPASLRVPRAAVKTIAVASCDSSRVLAAGGPSFFKESKSAPRHQRSIYVSYGPYVRSDEQPYRHFTPRTAHQTPGVL